MRWLGAPVLAVAAVAAALLASEGVARLGFPPPRYHSEPLQLDPELGFRGIPGHRGRGSDDGAHALVLNDDGFRGRPLPRTPGDAAGDARSRPLRIAFVGDSFLVGAGVAETQLLVARVEAALQARGRAAEAWNLSAADYGTGQQLLLLRRIGARLRPDRVVLAVYPPNDVINNFEGLAFRTGVSPGDPIRPYVVPGDDGLEVRYAQPWRAALRRHSRLFALLELRAIAFGARHQLGWLRPFELPRPPAERIAEARAPFEHQEIYRPSPPGSAWEDAWQRSFALLSAFRDECEALSARLLVVVIPELHQVRRVAQDVELDLRLRALRGEPLDRYLDWNLPERRLARFFRKERMDFVLLLPRLRAAVAGGEEVYLRDLHLSARGHALAAGAILDALDGTAPASDRADPDGRPVPLPDPQRAPRTIDPSDPHQWRYRSPHWIRWQPSPDAPSPGALALQHAAVALPLRGDELLVKGIAAARRYPLDVRLELVGGPGAGFRIEKPGPFVLRTRLPAARPPTSDGYTALVFTTDAAADAGEITGLIVEEVGFPESR